MKQNFRKLLHFFLILIFLTACKPALLPETGASSGNNPSTTIGVTEPPVLTTVSPIQGLPQGTDGYPWWNDSVFYEIFVRSFYDSDGDGIGDFNGIIQKLDYLNDGDPDTSTDLGITGIWLMPIYPSPSYHGYDVTDYYDVNPQYGTLDDFKALLAEAHRRGIRIILDLVLNHTSSQNPWFQQGVDPQSPYHDWYIWSDNNPGYAGPWGQNVWHPLNGKYYYGVFTSSMPDLNYRNPAVVAEMENVTKFWLDLGVDGFRLDAAKHIVEEGETQANSDATHTWWATYHDFIKPLYPQSLTVGEVWDTVEINSEYIQGDQLDLTFEFYLADAFIESANTGTADKVITLLQEVMGVDKPLQYATFLTNHDQNRLMNLLDLDTNKVMVAASLLLTSPGAPFIYYGEEIGMEGEKPDERLRAPMQWSSELAAGFSTVTPWELPGDNWNFRNVEQETGNPLSLLSHYRSLIQARNQHAALRVGDWTRVYTGNASLYACLRISQDEAVLVLINLSGDTISDYALRIDGSNLVEGNNLAFGILDQGEYASLSVGTGGGFFGYKPITDIAPYGTYLLQLKPFNP